MPTGADRGVAALLLDRCPGVAGASRARRPVVCRPPCAGVCHEVRDPGAGGLNSQRIRPGRRYGLPEAALQARVTPFDRDLLLQLRHGGLLLLRDLITVEVMADPAVFQVGARDFLASLVAALALSEGGGASLQALCGRPCCRSLVPPRELVRTLAGLRHDGTLPPPTAPEWNLP